MGGYRKNVTDARKSDWFIRNNMRFFPVKTVDLSYLGTVLPLNPGFLRISPLFTQIPEEWFGARLIRRRQFHAAGEIQNPAAVRTGDDFRLRAAIRHNLRRQLHVAAAASAVFHADDHVLALALEQALVAVPRRFVYGGRQLRAASRQFRKIFLQIFFALVQLADLVVHELLRGGGLDGGAGHFLLRRLGLFHQNNFGVLNLKDDFLGHLDFVGERLIFFILARLQLLVEVLLNLRLFAFDFEVALFAFRFDLFYAQLRRFERGLGAGGLGLERFAFGADVGQFLGDTVQFPVAIL